jgi:hypothetical protein
MILPSDGKVFFSIGSLFIHIQQLRLDQHQMTMTLKSALAKIQKEAAIA